MTHQFKILLLNGPNLNLLGSREPSTYGKLTLNEIINHLTWYAKELKVSLEHLQSNAEYELIERIHLAKNKVNYIIFNPAAFTHTSIALRDALLAVKIPFVEVHLSNVYAREDFRHQSYFSDISNGVICGFGTDGYLFALDAAVKHLKRIRSK
ncbi:MAG: type II 3-dehydroquinate dehydratase [Candidatus Dasytiphilus stammeri]